MSRRFDLAGASGGNGAVRFRPRFDSGVVGRGLVRLYGLPFAHARRLVHRLCSLLQGGHYPFYSRTLREIMRRYHGVTVGMYSHGACFVPGALRQGSSVGRFCSLDPTMSAPGNHPGTTRSTHAFFFNPALGYVGRREMESGGVTIGNDVWVGHNAVILPSCTSIGDGAIIGAGAVVHKNIPAFAVVVGNPARIVRYRFSPEKIEEILRDPWWEHDMAGLAARLEEFTRPVEAGIIR